MKLLTKTILYIATLSLFLFFLMGIIFFQLLKKMSQDDLDREMKEMQESIRKNLPVLLQNDIHELPGIDSLSIEPVQKLSGTAMEFRDTLLFDRGSKQYRTYHIHTFGVKTKENLYRIRLIKSTSPNDKLVERVTLMMTLMVILFLSGIFFLNRFIFSNLWKDFFTALDKLKRFNAEQGAIKFKGSGIEEFNELNRALEKITERLSKNYMELKEYTDNTTHELQTPLAVIKTKTELLLQSENLRESEIGLIRDIYRNTDHLSRLNATLALITRIDNQQFNERIKVDFAALIDKQLEMLQELIELRKIKVQKQFHGPGIIVHMDPGLADILIINLLKNAINHNIDRGLIIIELLDNKLMIKNSGVDFALDPAKLFDRFYRGTSKSESFGLGLHLVKKICGYYGFSLEYKFEESLHTFIVGFRS